MENRNALFDALAWLVIATVCLGILPTAAEVADQQACDADRGYPKAVCRHRMRTDIRPLMEAENARWLAAFNASDSAAFPAMYARDAVLLPPGAQAAVGPEAIREFWAAAIKRGVTDHTYTIVATAADDRYAYQVARWTASVLKDTGEKTALSGNTVRVFERQPDGSWLTKVHIYNRHQ